MRLYTFCNMYLSSIQQGIQSLHVLGDMVAKYSKDSDIHQRAAYLQLWAAKHKTVIVCNGGYSSSISELIDFFDTSMNVYPWANFYEGEDALNGALTAVGIILPDYIYDTKDLILVNTNAATRVYEEVALQTKFEDLLYFHEIRNKGYVLTEFEFNLMKKIKQYPLAR